MKKILFLLCFLYFFSCNTSTALAKEKDQQYTLESKNSKEIVKISSISDLVEDLATRLKACKSKLPIYVIDNDIFDINFLIGLEFLINHIYETDQDNFGRDGEYILRNLYAENPFRYIRYSVESGENETKIFIKVTYMVSEKQEKWLTQKIDTLIKSLELDSASDYEKVYKIYQWIEKNITYVYNDENENGKFSTAYAAMKYKKCSSAGYLQLFHRILLYIGIESHVVSGSRLHEWNVIKIDNLYYYTDISLDACIYYCDSEEIKDSNFLRGAYDLDDHFINPLVKKNQIIEKLNISEFKYTCE